MINSSLPEKRSEQKLEQIKTAELRLKAPFLIHQTINYY